MKDDHHNTFARLYYDAIEQEIRANIRKDPAILLGQFPVLSERLRETGLTDKQIASVFVPIEDAENTGKRNINSRRKTYLPLRNPKISKETFRKAMTLIQEQEAVDDSFGRALQKMGSGHFIFGTDNRYRQALLMVLKEAVSDQYDYIDWWLYEGAPDYEVWSSDESKKWILKEPEALFDFITTECK